jgi:hypothetical protein
VFFVLYEQLTHPFQKTYHPWEKFFLGKWGDGEVGGRFWWPVLGIGEKTKKFSSTSQDSDHQSYQNPPVGKFLITNPYR